MMGKNIAHIVVGLPVDGPFDYLVPEKDRDRICVGHRALVPFGGRQLTGYVTGFSSEAQVEQLKAIIKVLDEEPILDEHRIALAKSVAAHYGCSMGEAVETMLPFSVRRRKSLPLKAREARPFEEKGGTHHQSELVCGLMFDPSLQKNIVARIAEVRAAGRGVLCLAPDADCAQHLYEMVDSNFKGQVLYVDLKPGKRQIEQWLSVWSGEARIVVSVRSGVFLPVRDLGLIVLTDEDRYGYVEDQTPFYHAREVAVMRARQEGCDLIVTARVPTVEAWQRAQEERWKISTSSGEGPGARFVCVDLKNYKPQKSLHCSVPIFQALTEVVLKDKKALVLLNRRGFGTFLHCPQCDLVMRCPRCEVPFAYIEEDKVFLCPRCQKREEATAVCPSCKKTNLKFSGGGVERVASDLSRILPQARICVVDRKKKVIPKSANICVATQAVFQLARTWRPDVAVVLSIDNELGHMDFRGNHKVFAELVTLKSLAVETLFVQTGNPDHDVFQNMKAASPDVFYAGEIQKRKELSLPPFFFVISIICRGAKKESALARSQDIYNEILKSEREGLEAHEPQEDFRSKLRDQFRFSIILKSKNLPDDLQVIRKILKSVKRKTGVTTTVQVDP